MAVTRSTTELGYGWTHQAERAKWRRRLDRGETFQCCCDRDDCTRHDGQCSTIITATSPWDLGHTDDRGAWTGPECVPCNRGAGGRNGNRVAREKRATVIRDW